MVNKPSDPKTFEDAIALLEDSVARLESGALTLEESLEVFEQGVAASRTCSKMLDKTRKRVQILVEKAEGEFQLEFLESSEDEPISDVEV